MSEPRIAIAHDYLAQYGGAERVVAAWSRLFPSAPIHTMAYAPEETYPDFRERTIMLPAVGRSRLFSRSVASFLPVLPVVAASIRISEPVDWVLASTSGFAHGFRSDAPIAAYCHSPARWLYESVEYSAGLSRFQRVALRGLTPYLRSMDRAAAGRVAMYIANSEVTRERIWRAYRIDAPIVHPPVALRAPSPTHLDRPLPEVFALCVARSRGYKNIALAMEAAEIASLPLVLVGAGTELLDRPEDRVLGLGRVSDADLTALYAAASVLLAVAHEDFGLTPVEAAQAGTPTVALDRGGYRETVIHGVTGLLAAELAGDVADALKQAVTHPWDLDLIRAGAERFSPECHKAELLELLSPEHLTSAR